MRLVIAPNLTQPLGDWKKSSCPVICKSFELVIRTYSWSHLAMCPLELWKWLSSYKRASFPLPTLVHNWYSLDRKKDTTSWRNPTLVQIQPLGPLTRGLRNQQATKSWGLASIPQCEEDICPYYHVWVGNCPNIVLNLWCCFLIITLKERGWYGEYLRELESTADTIRPVKGGEPLDSIAPPPPNLDPSFLQQCSTVKENSRIKVILWL